MKKSVNIEKVKSDAEDAYRSGQMYCAEAVVSSIRKNIDPDMPVEFLSVATGFSYGTGRCRCMCGAVSGACICLGYFFGRSFPTTPTDPKSTKNLNLAFELQDSFKKKNKVLCCKVHNADSGERGSAANPKCVGFVGDMAAKAAEIVAREYGLSVSG